MAGQAVVGIDVGGTKTLLALVDPHGGVQVRRRMDTPQRGPQDFVRTLVRELWALLQQAGRRREEVLGLGVGAPGPLDPQSGVVFEPPNLAGWRDVPLAAMLREAAGIPTWVENDANAAALAEAWVGVGVGVRDLIYITVSTGIGGGLILNGELYHGVSGTAGEVGHMTVEPEGPLCGCGRRGHLEAVASGGAIARMAQEAVRTGRETRLRALAPQALTAEAVAEAAGRGDEVAREVYARAGSYIGLAVASLVNVLNPAMVVFGGGVSKAGDLLLEPVRRVVRERAFQRPAAAVRIVPAALGDDVGVIGAAAVVYRRARE
ncbi:MAG: ROK family glucokinase [Armatimonadota bacterium]|nr:ROK family glucokinase [Armatimonadota bacterium]MDR7426059.1 ROK family glucokinase [Armatimonadota bacterium]MDR7464712.1 ROK family glucokinase [Armatimonadota bacterium]MDR7469058.1 ROK family glucokinase [Armatimonadota bacterium]MDR7474260.1 ROK family glucokinase [Armatimonadota bacterium]